MNFSFVSTDEVTIPFYQLLFELLNFKYFSSIYARPEFSTDTTTGDIGFTLFLFHERNFISPDSAEVKIYFKQ